MMLNSRSASAADNAAVGSSITMSRALSTSARVMLMSQFSAVDRPLAFASSGARTPTRAAIGATSLAIAAPIDDAEARLFRHAQHDVLEHRHARDERQLLMDEAHAELVRDMRAIGDDALAVDENVATVRLCKTRKYADESRLARAVCADEPVHFAWKNRQRDTAQRLSAAVSSC